MLGARAGSSPSVIEVAEYMSIDSEQVIEALDAIAAHHAASLDEPIAPELPRTRARAMTSAGGRRRATVGRDGTEPGRRQPETTAPGSRGAGVALPLRPHTARDRRTYRHLTDAGVKDSAASHRPAGRPARHHSRDQQQHTSISLQRRHDRQRLTSSTAPGPDETSRHLRKPLGCSSLRARFSAAERSYDAMLQLPAARQPASTPIRSLGCGRELAE